MMLRKESKNIKLLTTRDTKIASWLALVQSLRYLINIKIGRYLKSLQKKTNKDLQR